MNSAIHLCQIPVPTAPGRLSSASRVHVSLSHGSVSVSQSSKRSHSVSRPLYVNCTLDRLSEKCRMNEENGKNSIVRGMGGASLALACVLGVFTLSVKMNPKPNVAHAISFWPTQVSQTQSVFDSLQQLICSTRKVYFAREPDYANIEVLKLFAMALSNSNGDGKKKAEKILREECERWKGSQASIKLSLALTELLFYQKKHEQACHELKALMASDDYKRDVLKAEIDQLKAIVDWWEKYHEERADSPYSVPYRPKS